MAEIPFFVYSLADELTLCDYEAGIEVSVDRIRERSIKEARKYNYYLPDYVFRNRFDSESEELEKTEWLSDYLVNGLTFHEEWMQIMSVCPPLIIVAAYFLEQFQREDKKKVFFEKVLVKQFKGTAQRRPLMFDLENIVKREGGLSDMHIHLNGSTETDVLWWKQMGCIDYWIDTIRDAFRKNLVKQQYEQENYSDINLLINRIRRAKELIVVSYKNETWDDEVFERIENLYHPYREYPVLAKAAYYYLVMLNRIQHGSERLARLFHQILLIESMVHKLVVQQDTQKGFTQFQMITENDIRWKHEATSYRDRFEQLAVDVDFCFLEYLEGRFAPKPTKEGNRELIKRIVSDFLSIKEKIETIAKVFSYVENNIHG